MGVHAAGEVVFLRFPFSDLTGDKLRPAVLLAQVGQTDWIACQITSNPYIDRHAIRVGKGEFADGGLRHTSYIRPGKLFTANERLMRASVGSLTALALRMSQDAVVSLVRPTEP